ncbi:hypothetical protein [Streptomyces tendae]|uniref:Uncharacterized protein n=1 Tax=Streptomyces tendae TaxID=1932 RepID=A0ABW7RZS7_STRTE
MSKRTDAHAGGVHTGRTAIAALGPLHHADPVPGQEREGLLNLVLPDAVAAASELATNGREIEPASLLKRVFGFGVQEIDHCVLDPTADFLRRPKPADGFSALVRTQFGVNSGTNWSSVNGV